MRYLFGMSLSDTELQRLAGLLAQLRACQGTEVHRAALAELAGLTPDGTQLTIDFAAVDTLGAPLVVLTPVTAGPDASFDGLTPRQREVAGLVATGLRNKDIALALGIRVATVKDHVHAILERTGLDSRAAVAAAWRGHAPGS